MLECLHYNQEIKYMENSLTTAASDFFFSPANLANSGTILGRAYYHRTGREALTCGLAGSALLLVQTVASAAAIPIQILAGVFSCLCQFLKGEYKEGRNELINGFSTSGKHVFSLILSPCASIVVALLLIANLPHILSTWNTYSQWWDPDSKYWGINLGEDGLPKIFHS
jgi:hypothetical protein